MMMMMMMMMMIMMIMIIIINAITKIPLKTKTVIIIIKRMAKTVIKLYKPI